MIYMIYGKHLKGDRILILLLNLPFVFRDLIAPKVVFPSTRYHIMAYIMYDITCPASRAGCLVANLLGHAPLIQCFITTVTPLSHTASRTVGVLDMLLLTRSWTGATASGSTR